MITEYSDGWICYIFYSLQYSKVYYKHIKMSVENQPNFIGSVHDGKNGIKDKCDFFIVVSLYVAKTRKKEDMSPCNTNSNFLIGPLHPDDYGLKCLRSTTLGCKDIRIRKKRVCCKNPIPL